MFAFWITIWVFMTARALELGYGLGIGDDEIVYPCGQKMVNGELDGIPADPAKDRWDPATKTCGPR